MRIQQIIDNYCRQYGVDTHNADWTKTQCFVTISPDGLQVLPVHKPSKLLGCVVGAAMKRGAVLYVRSNRVTPLTWNNWKGTWSRLFAPKERNKNTPEPNSVRPYKSEMFESMQQKRAPKKPQKNGFEGTYIANKSLHLLSIVS